MEKLTDADSKAAELAFDWRMEALQDDVHNEDLKAEANAVFTVKERLKTALLLCQTAFAADEFSADTVVAVAALIGEVRASGKEALF